MTSRAPLLILAAALLWATVGRADPPPAVAVVTDLRGRVERRAAGDEAWTPIALDEAVWLRDAVRTGPRSLAELRFMDGTVLALGERTRLRISLALFDPEQAPPEIRVALLDGEAEVRTATTPLVVTAPDGSERRLPPGIAAHIRLAGPAPAPGLEAGPARPGLAADFEAPPGPHPERAPMPLLDPPSAAVPGDPDPLRAVPGDATPIAPLAPLPEPGPTGIRVRVRVRGETP